MNHFLALPKYSVGVGDRFERQAEAQLRACMLALEGGVTVQPVWNKSNREHVIIGSEPAGTRAAADAAVKALGWKGGHLVDADHIRLETVDRFIPHSDFFTIDVADYIGVAAEPESIRQFVQRHAELGEGIRVPGIETPLRSSKAEMERIAGQYLRAVEQAGKVYEHSARVKDPGTFVCEVSLDETEVPQSALELLVVLAALADEGLPVQTIAPKFPGSFHKGVDYVGDVAQFERAFSEDLAVVAFAVAHYALPDTLKLSLHSGSDKFSLYRPIRAALERFGAGLHLKTAGTTWLEELVGIAEGGRRGFELARKITLSALKRLEELCAPYANVIGINQRRLPTADTINSWDTDAFVSAIRHDLKNPRFNPDLRQLLHVAYKIAAETRGEFLQQLDSCRDTVARNVTFNLYERHIMPVFMV